MIFKVAPINEDHKFDRDEIYVKVYNLYSDETFEFEMSSKVYFEEFEDHIIERYRFRFPVIQYEDEQGDKMSIDSQYSFEHALKTSDKRSRYQRLEQVVLEVFVNEKDGYVFD
mmetsp:Transcript_28776/g.28484  ORF Transcript_28776/g.28484 Transcript_28776/m.28484 type:complete len:113 (-) Transcript_28776:267-605(-)